MPNPRSLLAAATLAMATCLTGCVIQLPNTTATLPDNTTTATLPATFNDGWIDLHASINGHQTRTFTFDTGASYGVVTRQTANELGLRPLARATGTDIFDKEVTGTVAIARSVRAGDLTLTDVPFLIADGIQILTKQRDVDGIIGLRGFETFTIDIDAPNQALRVSTAPLDPAAPGSAPLQWSPGHTPKTWYSSKDRNQQTRTGWASIDTGGDTTIQLSNADTQNLISTPRRRVFATSYGLSGHTKAHRIAPLTNPLHIGSTTINNVEAATDAPETLIGHRLLRHLRVQLDLMASRAAITSPHPLGQVDLPRTHDVGITQTFMPEDAIFVLGIRDRSPAALAGLQPNDRILAVNGTPVTEPDCDLTWCGTPTPRPHYTLTIERDDRVFDVTLATEPSFPDDLDKRAPDLQPKPARIITNPDGTIRAIEIVDD